MATLRDMNIVILFIIITNVRITVGSATNITTYTGPSLPSHEAHQFPSDFPASQVWAPSSFSCSVHRMGPSKEPKKYALYLARNREYRANLRAAARRSKAMELLADELGALERKVATLTRRSRSRRLCRKGGLGVCTLVAEVLCNQHASLREAPWGCHRECERPDPSG